MLDVLWVNNVSSICGGTLQCTHSMIQALPDCKHTVFAFSKGFSAEAKQAFGSDVRLVAGNRLKDLLQEYEPNLVVYQNTPAGRIPAQPPPGALTVYYQHSAGGRGARSKAHHQFSVSHWLAKKCGMPDDSVIYQPVTIPPKKGTRPEKVLRVGRICTPNEKKWRREEIEPYLKAVRDEMGGRVQFDFVGGPTWCEEYGRCIPASVSAKSLLHEWHVLLYTSEVEESYGRVVKEAQRCGCVPVVSRRGGFVEQIANESGVDCGFLVETPEDATLALMEVEDNPQWWSRHVLERGDMGSLGNWRREFLSRLLA